MEIWGVRCEMNVLRTTFLMALWRHEFDIESISFELDDPKRQFVARFSVHKGLATNLLSLSYLSTTDSRLPPISVSRTSRVGSFQALVFRAFLLFPFSLPLFAFIVWYVEAPRSLRKTSTWYCPYTNRCDNKHDRAIDCKRVDGRLSAYCCHCIPKKIRGKIRKYMTFQDVDVDLLTNVPSVLMPGSSPSAQKESEVSQRKSQSQPLYRPASV